MTGCSTGRHTAPRTCALPIDALARPMIVAIDGASTDLSVALAAPNGSLSATTRGDRRSASRPSCCPALLASSRRMAAAFDDITALARGHRPGIVHRPPGGDGAGQGPRRGARPADRRRAEPRRPGWRPRRRQSRPSPAPGRARHTSSTRGDGCRPPRGRAALPGAARRRGVVAPAELAEAFGLGHAPSHPARPPPSPCWPPTRLDAAPGRRRPATPGADLPPRAARRRGRDGRRASDGSDRPRSSSSRCSSTTWPAVHEIERMSFRTPWPAHAFEQELRGNRLARYLVARAGDAVVGFAGVWLMVDDAHVTTFGVHPDWRRQGIGRRLLLELAALSRRDRGAADDARGPGLATRRRRRCTARSASRSSGAGRTTTPMTARTPSS